jgi:hypothetical protein
MAQILIRNVDEERRRAFKAALAQRGETMQSYLETIVGISAKGVDIVYVLDRARYVAQAVLDGTAKQEEIVAIAKNVVFQLSKSQEG